MSKDLYFFKIRRIPEPVPDVINLDQYDYGDNPCPYAYTEEAKAKDWEKEYGVLTTVEYMTVDFWSVAEKELGVRPNSSVYHPYTGDQTFYRDGEKLGTLTREELNKHKYKKSFPAYVYIQEKIASCDGPYDIPEIQEGIMTHDELVKLAERMVQATGGEYYSYLGEQLWVIVQAVSACAEGDVVYAEWD